MAQINDVIKFWENQTDVPESSLYIHPADLDPLASFYQRRRRNALIDPLDLRDVGPCADDTNFHFKLRPVPYLGDLRHATVCILTLNPFVDCIDYEADGRQEFQRALARNIRQDSGHQRIPCLALDATFSYSGWFKYWESKFRAIACCLAGAQTKSYSDALATLAAQVVIIELVPYYSIKSPDVEALQKIELPSMKMAVAAAQEFADRARKGDAIVVVLRRTTVWGLEHLPGRVIRTNGGIGASLSPRAESGSAILESLGVRSCVQRARCVCFQPPDRAQTEL